jgi:hypothetical protein
VNSSRDFTSPMRIQAPRVFKDLGEIGLETASSASQSQAPLKLSTRLSANRTC